MNWRRILILSIALVSVLTIATWTILQNSDAATIFVRKIVKDAFTTRTTIASTSINLEAGRLNISGFEVADPTRPKRNLARVADARIDFQADPFGTGIGVRHIVIEGLELDCGPSWPTAKTLLSSHLDSLPQSGGLDIPVVDIRSGKATLQLIDGERPLTFSDLEFTLVPLASDRQKLQLKGALTLIAPSARLELTGEMDVASGAGHLTITASNIDCNQSVVAYLARLAKVKLQDFDIGGQIDSLSLRCNLPPNTATDRTPSFQVLAKCSDVHLDAQGLPPIIRHASVSLFADTKGRGQIQANVEQQNEAGSLSVKAKVGGLKDDDTQTLEIWAEGHNVAINADTIAAMRSFPTGEQLVEALRPTTGRADIKVFLMNPAEPGGITEIDLALRDGGMSFQGFGNEERRIGFPLVLENASGRVQLREEILLLEDMKASIPESAGGGTVTLVGRVEIGRPPGENTSLDIHGDSIAFSSQLESAMTALLRDDGALYDRLSPTGRTSVHVTVRPRSQLPDNFRVVIKPNGAAMRWAGFPYRLDNLRGSIHVSRNDAQFDLTGHHGDGRLTMQGRIPLHLDHTATDGFEAVITADNLALDEDLRSAVATVVPELDPQWRKAAPTGRLSGEIKVWRPLAEDPLFHDIRLSLHEVDLLLPLAPWRATGLLGQVLVQGSGPKARIDFDSLRGQLENDGDKVAQLGLLGHLESGKKAVRDLAFVVRDLELNEQLGRSLDQLKALDFSTWSSLKPSGKVDLVCHERAGGDEGANLELVLQLVDVRSEAKMLPRPVEHMTGELHIEGGELTFRDVRGQLGTASVHCTNGRVHQLPADDGRTEISFNVHAKNLPIDDGLANLFSGPLRQAVLERQLRGQADVDGLHLRFAIPTRGNKQPFSTTIGGSISLDGVDMLLGTGQDGIRVNNLHGLVKLEESTVNDLGGQLSGTLGRGTLSLFGHPLDAIEAAFTTNADRLTVSTLKARMHDGELRNAEDDRPALTYLLPAPDVPQGRLAGDLAYEGIEVYSLLTAGGWNNPPYSGSASGRATLRHLDGNKVIGAKAEGTLKIERADLGKVPLFKAIYAQLPPADQPRFNMLDLTFRLTEQEIVFDELDVRSEILAVKGSGSLNLDGYLDVAMELDNLLGQSVDPLVMPLIEYLAQNLVSFRLYGHLRDLRAQTQLMGSSAPKRPPVLPMPPVRGKAKPSGF